MLAREALRWNGWGRLGQSRRPRRPRAKKPSSPSSGAASGGRSGAASSRSSSTRSRCRRRASRANARAAARRVRRRRRAHEPARAHPPLARPQPPRPAPAAQRRPSAAVPTRWCIPPTRARSRPCCASPPTPNLAVVPFGGATSVVGGIEPRPRAAQRGAIALDTTRARARCSALDPESRTATFQAGIFGPSLEARLREHGFTLGHFPQSVRALDARRLDRGALGSGQHSSRYGALEDLLVACAS